MQFHIELSECGKMPQLLYNQAVIFANMKLLKRGSKVMLILRSSYGIVHDANEMRMTLS